MTAGHIHAGRHGQILSERLSLMNRFDASFLPRGIAVLTLAFSASALADCVPVQGKIFNNAIDQGTTLGVVGLDGPKNHAVKLKCALVGSDQGASFPQLHFIHSISCDDAESDFAYDASGKFLCTRACVKHERTSGAATKQHAIVHILGIVGSDRRRTGSVRRCHWWTTGHSRRRLQEPDRS